jgi:endoglucanase
MSRSLRTASLSLAFLLIGMSSSVAIAQSEIRVNQIGYYASGPKVGAIIEGEKDTFTVVEYPNGSVVFDGIAGPSSTWAPSGESVRLADFSSLRLQGRFVLRVGEVVSAPFDIGVHVHEGLARAALKAFYYQRASRRLRPEYAGEWARFGGHPDTHVIVHPSAASPDRPAGTIISAPKGWYDAGDYNKYVVNSGISTYTVLTMYEHFPMYMEALDTNIPESGGPLPDALAEALWNLEWILAMQDPNDGGVYHKLTSPNFSGYVLPYSDTAPRYVVQKSTAATLNFAAVMAQASRIFEQFDAEYAALSDSMRNAAIRAWNWARNNPEVFYDQAAMNREFEPEIHTGEYGDGHVSDEFAWAAMELFITTGADSFLMVVPDFVSSSGPAALPAWPQVRTLGLYSILDREDWIGPAARADDVRNSVLSLANSLRSRQETSAMRTSMSSGDFYWGSNSVAANQGIALMQAFRATQDSTYLSAAVGALDYLLGRNGVGITFVTGHGTTSPMHPHHRPSIAGSSPQPVPGFLVGGPNPGRQDRDGCAGYGAAGQYPSTLPARAYLDHRCSYASNEVAINWNAPLAYLAVAVEVAMSTTGVPSNLTPVQPDPGPTAIGELRIHPNPIRDRAMIDHGVQEPGAAMLQVIDMLGRLVHSESRWIELGQGLPLDLSDLPVGVYVVRVQTASMSASSIIILAR